MRPGSDVTIIDIPPPRSAPTDTGVWFVVGATAQGPMFPVAVRSLQDYTTEFGVRTGYTMLYDCIETYFREGGGVAVVSCIPTLVNPTLLSAGEQSADDDEEAEEKAEKKGGKVGPGTQAVPVDADYLAALARMGASLGPGQVSVPGITTPAVQQGLLDHAASHNRTALLDGLAAGTSVQQIALATAMKVTTNARYGGIFGPYATIPGLTAGTTRSVPWSAVEAGIIGRNDSGGNPNLAAAGVNGVSRFAIGLSTVYTDQEYADMNTAGVDMARMVYGVAETYGYRTVADQSTPVGQDWVSLGWTRLAMAIAADADVIGERYVFSQIDGRGLTISQFGAELRAMLIPYWSEGALYGVTADDAFEVDVGSQVNTPTTIANGELHAVIRLKMSPFAEWVVINIFKIDANQPLASAA